MGLTSIDSKLSAGPGIRDSPVGCIPPSLVRQRLSVGLRELALIVDELLAAPGSFIVRHLL